MTTQHIDGAPVDAPPQQMRRKSTVSALIGNYMEFFDFGVYGFLAVTIGQLFFPGADPTLQLLSSFAAFGVAFLFRPLGGALFGFIGDRFGRRVSLSGAIILMSIATALIGLLPVHATAGVLAPVLLVVLRCVQGISVGGEFSGGSTFIAEFAHPKRRGRSVSLMSTTAALGTVTGSALVLIMTASIGDAAMLEWGWRIPFLVALPIGAIGLYMRLRLDDTPVFKEMQQQADEPVNPFKSLRRRDIGHILLTFAFAGATGLGFYYFTTYFPNYLTTTLGFERPVSIGISMAAIAFYAFVCIGTGALSDRIGRKRTYVIGFFSMALLAIPIFWLMGLGPVGAIVGLLLYAFPQAMNNVMVSIVPVELFSARVRVTAGAIGYNLGVGLISGTGPLVATALVAATGSPLAPAFYLAGIVLIAGFAVLLALPETSKRSLYLDAEPTSTPEARA